MELWEPVWELVSEPLPWRASSLPCPELAAASELTVTVVRRGRPLPRRSVRVSSIEERWLARAEPRRSLSVEMWAESWSRQGHPGHQLSLPHLGAATSASRTGVDDGGRMSAAHSEHSYDQNDPEGREALWLASYPFDVIKSKMQTDGFGAGQKYKSMRDCFGQTFRAEGARGFWKGIGPTLLRAMPVSAGTFAVVEFTMRAIN